MWSKQGESGARRVSLAALAGAVALVMGGLAGSGLSLIGAAPAGATDSNPSDYTWQDVTSPPNTPGDVAPVTAYDPATGAVVMVDEGYADIATWTFDGSSWSSQGEILSNSYADGTPLLAYDDASSQLVMLLNDRTMVWSGSAWQPVASSPVSTAVLADSGALSYDAATQQLVFVDEPEVPTSSDPETTWVWSGSAWSELSPTTSPSARNAPAMSFDPSTGGLVLFGGCTGGTLLNDTWTWDGSTWTAQAPATSPPGRCNAALSPLTVSAGLLLYGGIGSSPLDDTWIWDGSTWTAQAPSDVPELGSGAAMASRFSLSYDTATSQPVLVIGDADAPVADLQDVYGWNGSDWQDLTPPESRPDGAGASAAAYDAATGQLVQVGGDQTFVRDDTSGTWDPAGTAPAGMNTLGYDASSQQLIDFQQTDGAGQAVANTWSWNGTGWTELAPATSPDLAANSTVTTYPWGVAASLAFDTTSDQLILVEPVAGSSADTEETWAWDGTDWSNLAPSTSPPARNDASLANDPGLGGLVMFGGADSSTADPDDDTWLWNGSDWAQISTSDSPPPESGAAMAYDPAFSEPVLFGGYPGSPTSWSSPSDEMWAFDGQNWTELTPAESPAGRVDTALVWDPTISELIVVAGGTPDTWVFTTAFVPQPTITSIVPGNGYATITWTPAALGAGVEIDDYLITQTPVDGAIGPVQQQNVAAIDGDTYQFDGGMTGSDYTYTVQPLGPDGTYPVSATSAPVTIGGPPGVPTDVTMTCGDGTVTLSWGPPASSAGSAPVTGYTIYYDATGNPVTVGADVTSDTLTGFTNGAGQLLSVAADSDAGSSQREAAPVCTPYADVGAPTLETTMPGDGQVTVTWSPAQQTSDSLPITGYQVMGIGTGRGPVTATLGPDATSATLTGVVDDVPYFFEVDALTADGLGPPSDISPYVEAMPPAQVPSVTAVTPGHDAATVTWAEPKADDHAVTGYVVTASNGSRMKVSASATSATVTKLKAGTRYTFSVAAEHGQAVGPATSRAAKVPTAPAAPVLKSAVAGVKSVTVNWAPPASDGGAAITAYVIQIRRCSASASTCTLDKSVAVKASARSLDVTGLSPGVRYSFSVKASNVAGRSKPSASLRAVPKA